MWVTVSFPVSEQERYGTGVAVHQWQTDIPMVKGVLIREPGWEMRCLQLQR